MALVAALPADARASGSEAARALRLGDSVEALIDGAAVHAYRLSVAGGGLAELAVEPRGLWLRVLGPAGEVQLEKGITPEFFGARLLLRAELPTEYLLEVATARDDLGQPIGGPPVRYTLRLASSRFAGEELDVVLAAQAALQEAAAASRRVLRAELSTAAGGPIAREKSEAALRLSRSVGDAAGEAQALEIQCPIRAANEGHAEGERCFGRMLELAGAAGDRAAAAMLLIEIAERAWIFGEPARALELYQQAYSASAPAGTRALLHQNMAVAHRDLGEYQQALDHHRRALEGWRDYPAGRAFALDGLGRVYFLLGEDQRALDHHMQALEVWRSIGQWWGEAQCLTSIAAVNESQGELQAALDAYTRAREIFDSRGEYGGAGRALASRGWTRLALGEPRLALSDFEAGLAALRKAGHKSREADALRGIAEARWALGESAEALARLNEALEIQRAARDRAGEARTLVALARCEAAAGRLAAAKAAIETALERFEALRSQLPGPEQRLAYSASSRRAHELHVDLLMRLDAQQPDAGHAAAALEAAERARARSLVETLSAARVDLREGADPELLERERALERAMRGRASWLAREAPGTAGEARASEVRQELDRLLEEYREARDEIRARSPRYAALTQTRVLSASRVQELLDPETLLLEYSLGEERSYLFAVTSDSLHAFVLPARAEIESVARRVKELLAQGQRRAAIVPTGRALAALGEMLLRPVAPLIGGRRLAVVPEGVLQFVPFSALPDVAAPGPGAKEPLIVGHEVVLLPSATALATLRAEYGGRAAAPRAVAVFADPVLEREDPRLGARRGPRADPASTAQGDLARSAADTGVARFRRLPFTRQEAEAILGAVGAQPSFSALDFDANREAALSPELAGYRILHFASHGLLDSVRPELSGLVLSLYDAKGQARDGFLRLHDLYSLRLNADLVVLSACRTALGKDIRGEGLVGLTRGFMYAGVPRVVASLWDVRDRATADLMSSFYAGMLREGLRPSAALRRAQVSLYRDSRWSAPFYWAGFVLQGEWR